MAAATLALNPAAEPVDQFLLDRHYHRKHGLGAYYGQPGDHAATGGRMTEKQVDAAALIARAPPCSGSSSAPRASRRR